MNTVKARRSASFKYVICGNRRCGEPLCRRDAILDSNGQPAQMVDGMLVPGEPVRTYALVWGDGWHVVDDHIEKIPSAAERQERGLPPGRHDWTNDQRLRLTDALMRWYPALCPACESLNTIDPRRLEVSRVAPRPPRRVS